MKLVCPNLVVGGCISSLIYATRNNYHVICNPEHKPFKLRQIKKINLVSEWSNLLLSLSLKGLVLNSKEIEGVRIKDSICTLVQRGGQRIEIEFKKCYIFSAQKLVCENEIKKQAKETYIVYDWIDTRSCSFHNFEYFKFNDELVSELFFYKSERITGDTKVKDIVSISHLTKNQLMDFNYSDTMVGFKIRSIMNSMGILGPRSGYQKNGNVKRSSLSIEPKIREVFLESESTFIDSKHIKFLNSSKKKDIIFNNYARTRVK
jgi:hypothetical protein